ncbi:hypothetical protein Hanom_Chr17g01554761 [Helianthus anomalus]
MMILFCVHSGYRLTLVLLMKISFCVHWGVGLLCTVMMVLVIGLDMLSCSFVDVDLVVFVFECRTSAIGYYWYLILNDDGFKVILVPLVLAKHPCRWDQVR